MSPAQRQMLDGPRSTFQIGDALSKTLSVWGKNLLPLLVVSVIVSIPTLLLQRQLLVPRTPNEAMLWSLAVILSSTVMNFLAAGAVTYAVVQQLRGRACGMGEALSVGLSRFFPVIGVAFLTMLAVLGGTILLIIPGIIVMLMLYVTVPVAIIEQPGLTASLSRSSALTKGVKGQIFVMLIVVGVLSAILQFIVNMVVGTKSLETQWLVNGGLGILFGSFGAVLPAVVYVLLRSAREGANIEDVAKVFD